MKIPYGKQNIEQYEIDEVVKTHRSDFIGLPVDLQAFRKLADEHGLWVIEDACHAPRGNFIDSEGSNIMCVQGKYSDFSVFSFHPVKDIAYGEGGMVTTNSKKIYEELMLLVFALVHSYYQNKNCQKFFIC